MVGNMTFLLKARADDEKIEPGYEIIEHDEIKFLKNLETRKLFSLYLSELNVANFQYLKLSN